MFFLCLSTVYGDVWTRFNLAALANLNLNIQSAFQENAVVPSFGED